MTTQIHKYHPRDTEEQLYDVPLHDVTIAWHMIAWQACAWNTFEWQKYRKHDGTKPWHTLTGRRITFTWRHKYMNVTHMTPKNNYMTYDYMTYNYKITVQEIIIYLYLTNLYYCTSPKLWLLHNLGPLRRWDYGRRLDDDNGIGKSIAHSDDSLIDKRYKNHKSKIKMMNGQICQI